jgi:hypothetical protein
MPLFEVPMHKPSVPVTSDADAASEAITQVYVPGKEIRAPFTLIPAKNTVNPPWVAAKGDDDVMSQQQQRKP